ncbi:MAG: hypothetical protein II219_02430 [Alphaproteobacteria bacterium]|nr:hypothetical protein [Alphaproteobacteria bacterium]
MKKIICILTAAFFIPHNVWGATLLGCQESSSKYTACKPGYYLSNGSCLECPERATGVTSADKNTIGITACYQTPTDSNGNAIEYSDNTGSYTISGNCYHK